MHDLFTKDYCTVVNRAHCINEDQAELTLSGTGFNMQIEACLAEKHKLTATQN